MLKEKVNYQDVYDAQGTIIKHKFGNSLVLLPNLSFKLGGNLKVMIYMLAQIKYNIHKFRWFKNELAILK